MMGTGPNFRAGCLRLEHPLGAEAGPVDFALPIQLSGGVQHALAWIRPSWGVASKVIRDSAHRADREQAEEDQRELFSPDEAENEGASGHHQAERLRNKKTFAPEHAH